MNRWHSSLSKIISISCLVAVLGLPFQTIAQADGEKLFKANCATCHYTSSKKLTGPGLEGAMERIPKKEWIYDWVRNSQKVIKAGDPYASQLWEEYGPSIMTPMEYLSNEQIDAIIAYVETKPHIKDDEPVEVATGAEVAEDDSADLWWLLILGVIFFIVVNVLAGVKRSLHNLLKEKTGQELIPDRTNWESIKHWMSTNKTQTALITLFVVICLSIQGWYALKGIAVYEGYAPEQPIKFSHKVHAGDNQINCVYCHHSAEKGKTSGIPSVNVCMNCHVSIDEGKQTGKTEIAKIYKAAGWNAEKKIYDGPQEPIKWVRIHNLPDFAYFNHSQHVVVGKQECQTCHGPVEEIGYPMYQHAPLTMGWCIDCHKKTNVDMAGNEYYEKLHADLKEKYKEEGLTSFKVEHIGGLECAKCHY